MGTNLLAQLRICLVATLFLLLPDWYAQLQAQVTDEQYHKLLTHARSLLPNQVDAADSLTRIVLDAAGKTNADSDSLKAQAYLFLGIIQHFKAHHLLSAEFYRQALNTRHARKDQHFAEACLNNLGIAEAQQGNFQKAVDACYRSLKLAEANGDSVSIMQSWNNISLFEARDKQVDKAIAIGKEVLTYTINTRDSLHMAIAHQNMGLFYSQREPTWTQATFNYQKANTLYEQLELPYYLIKCQLDYASFLMLKKAFAPAKEIYLQALRVSEASQFEDKMAIIYQRLAQLELDTDGDNRLAGHYLAKARRLVENSSLGILDSDIDILTLRYLARAGNPQLFDSTLTAFHAKADSISMQRNLSTLEGIKLKYDVEILEFQKIALEKGITQKNIILSITLLALLIALSATAIISHLYRKQRRHLNTMYQLNEQLAQRRPAEANILLPDSSPATEAVLPQTDAPENDEQEEEPVHPALYQLILHRLETKRFYVDPNFSIHELSEDLRCNRRIISKCIKEQGHTSFTVLVNQYRVNEARRLIRERGDEQALHEIAELVGFNNRISFYRCFKDYTGFSPSAYLERVRQGRGAEQED